MVNAVRQVKMDSTQFRRQKMAKKIDEQVKLAIAMRDGQTCVVKRLRSITDKATGLVSQMEVSKRINGWWWTEGNRILLQLKYGTRVLLLPDGHPKLLHLWPPKLPQAGRLNYQLFGPADSDFLSW